jgi:hypothetical protein
MGTGPRGPRGGREGLAAVPLGTRWRRFVGSFGHGRWAVFGTPYPDFGREPIQPPVPARPFVSSTEKEARRLYLVIVTINALNGLSRSTWGRRVGEQGEGQAALVGEHDAAPGAGRFGPDEPPTSFERVEPTPEPSVLGLR